MRESRTYGSGRGREVTRVPTAKSLKTMHVVCCGALVRKWHLASFTGVHKISTRLEVLPT